MEKERKRENMALHRKPHFFKVLLGDFAWKLKLPPNFLKHISNEPSENAILEGPNGCRWSVKIETTSDGTYLSSGWSKFVTYHSLKVREFLVFQYNGNMHFSIQVFDTTACEREDLFDLPAYKKPIIRFLNNESEEDVKKNINCINQGNSPIRIGKTNSETAGEAAKAFRSDFPSVIVHMTASKVCLRTGTMRLPTCFSQKYLPREKINMSLSDPNENVWTVLHLPAKKDRRDRLGGGWIKLVRANNINYGDYCVFELKAPTEMKVHIFRASRAVD